jgi:hypothetical protein
MTTRHIYVIALFVLCVIIVGLTFSVSGNPIFAATMGGLVCVIGLLAMRATGATLVVNV